MSKFDDIALGPPIEAFALNKACQQDTFQRKVNLTVGVYRTERGTPWLLPCVKKAEELLAQDDTLDHEYLPILGYEPFCKMATKLLLGEDSTKIIEGKAFGIQSLSGTGSLRVAAEFLARILNYNTVYISTPSWENHRLVFKLAGFTKIKEYRYWNHKTRGIDMEGLLEDLNNAPENSVIILHTCAHNPTGCDPTQDQWKLIADVIEQKKLFTIFDSAYQGFATGDVDNDAWPVRYFAGRDIELFCAQSFAKNFGLYNERVGNLTVIINNPDNIDSIKSQFTLIIRGMYSNPPCHGAKIVSLILSTPNLKKEWKECIKQMSGRIRNMRTGLKDRLGRLDTPGNWDHITTQIGMFSYTGLIPRQVEHMKKKYHIYMLKSGRISMSGLNEENLDYVAQAISDTIKTISEESKY